MVRKITLGLAHQNQHYNWLHAVKNFDITNLISKFAIEIIH